MTRLASVLEGFGVPTIAAGTIESLLLLLVGFVVLYVFGTRFVVPLIDRMLARRGLEEQARRPLVKISKFFVVFIALTLAFGIAGLGNFLLAFTGIAAAGTLAIGVAMQGVIRNFVSGVFIYIDRPFRIGDWIEWNDNVGIVEDIRLRTTRVRTFDNELLTVPNFEFTDNVVKNPVAMERIRQRFTVGIGFGESVRDVTNFMIEEAEKHPEILDEPETTVRLTELGDSAIILQSRFWITEPRRSDFIRIRTEYGTNVKRRLDDEGIDIPFPIRTLGGQVEITDGVLDSSA